VRNGLGHGGARERLLAGLLPVIDRTLGEAGLDAVLGEQLGFRVRRLGEAVLQRPDNAGVQLLPMRPQKALMGRVAHQRVLERVARLRRHTAPKHQLGRSEPVERAPQLGLGRGRDLRQEPVGELAPDAGCCLRHLLDVRHTI